MTAAVQRPHARSQPLAENERAIVTEWRLPPGAETGWHQHGFDYVVVCLTEGRLLAETESGDVETFLRMGEVYLRPRGVKHNIVNPGDSEFAFIEVEIK